MPLNDIYDPERYDVIGSGIDSATGVTRLFIKDEKKTFDKIVLFVNKNKKVTSVMLAKEFSSSYEAGLFNSIVYKKAKKTYPEEAIDLFGENDGKPCFYSFFKHT